VTQDALELQIQDYLDDRMNDGERRAFEERLANDDGLAERVNDLRAISEALGQDAPELPPGFHTRLRARFEARHAPARQWFRPLSWETAGLVAAVAFAAVLFLPVLMEQPHGQPDSQIVFEPEEQESLRNESREAIEEDRIETNGPESYELEESGATEGEDTDFAPAPDSIPEPAVEPDVRREQQRRDEPAKSRPAPPTGAKLKKAETPAPIQQAPAEPERTKRSRSGEKGAPADEESTTTSGRAMLGDTKEELRAQGDMYGDRSHATGGVALAAGVVEEGEILEIRSEEQWNRLVPGGYDPASRLVLVGTRDDTPADCARSVIVAAPDAYEIRLATATDAASGAADGCAFRLPADDLPVRVVGPRSAP
jgi:outer membrane biosynthesis protein TonB